jgi:hypothetical protein
MTYCNKKMSGNKLDTVPKIPVLNEFIEQMLDHYSLLSGKRPTPVADYDALDVLFIEMLHTVSDQTQGACQMRSKC